MERNDVIVVASVSCIFGLGDPREYSQQVVSLRVGMEMDRNELLKSLVDIQFERNDIDFQRGVFVSAVMWLRYSQLHGMSMRYVLNFRRRN